MAGEGNYSFSLTTFSPSGKLGQIEHALNAVQAGNTSLGIRAVDGAVVATESKVPTVLIEDSSILKVCAICETIGVVYSGMGPDFRVLLRKARKFAESYKRRFGEFPQCKLCVKELGAIMQDYTQSGGVRPFGVSLLVVGFDEGESKLYQVDPSGSFWAWKATAIGKNIVSNRTFLEKRYSDSIELEDAINTGILTLKENFDGEMTEKNIQIGVLNKKDMKFRVLTPSEITDYLREIE